MNEIVVEGGYDFKLVKEDTNLECPICLLILREAMGTQCRHLLCKVCLEKLQRSSDDAGRDLICPTCKENIDVNQVYPIFYIDGVVTGSDVYCLQQDSGCPWIGTLAAYLREHHETCDYVIVSCPNIGCGEKLARNLIEEHAVKCPYRLVKCVHCQMEGKFNKLDEHHYTECHKIPVDCVMGCGVQVPREKMETHINEFCGFVEIECQFSNAGCNSKVQRMDVHKHNLEFTQIHMAFLCDKLNQSQRKIEQIEIANNQSQKEIEILKRTETKSRKKIEQLEKANDQSQTEIEQLKIAKNQSKDETEELRRTISQIEQQKISNNRSQDEEQKNASFDMVASERFETEGNKLNPTASHYIPLINDLTILLIKGVEKWISNEVDTGIEYVEWYKTVSKKMELHSVHEHKDFIFLKTEIEPSRGIKWKFMNKIRPVTSKRVINTNDGWLVTTEGELDLMLYTDKYNVHNCRCYALFPGNIREVRKNGNLFKSPRFIIHRNLIMCLKLR